jgi:polyphosphate kinase
MTPRRPSEFINRELSWLEFNARVLEEAEDARNPLLERVRFYCIFHSNLDEFCMVRAASLMHKIEESDNKPDPSGLSPVQQLEAVRAGLQKLAVRDRELYRGTLLPELARQGIVLLDAAKLTDLQRSYLREYFDREVYPVLTPVAVDPAGPFPRLAGLATHLAVLLASEKDEAAPLKLALVQVPGKLPGLTRLPERAETCYCWLVDVIRLGLPRLFSGYQVREAAAFRLARDSELELDDEGFDDYLRMLETQLKRRQKSQPVRVEHDAGMSPLLLERIQTGLGVESGTLLPLDVPLDPRPLLTLVEAAGLDPLRFPQRPPLLHPALETDRGIFELLREADILLHHPYDSYDTVAKFIQQAADDPEVLAIKQTLYRTSGLSSPMVRALIRAGESGKQVTVLVELTARFDEERNISWARNLEDAGAHVIYGVAGLKVHAKIALVVRRETDGIRRYVHLGTGNYNERTSRIYTDLSLLTAAEEFGADASAFFNTITGYSEPPMFDRLLMAPNGMRQAISSLIHREIERAQAGQRAGITAKMNSLVDPDIIEDLYRASRAGVPIRLNVRGICCLRPGVPGFSENIRVISILDRHLEHSRLFVFENGGSPEVFASSADWMPRNLNRRIELMFPIIQEHCKRRAVADLEAQFADNQKARLLRPDGTYERLAAGRTGAFRVQDGLYKRLAEEYERMRSGIPVRFVPLENKNESR